MSKRIMIVDDAEFTRTMLTLELEHAGYTIVAVAQNGKDAFTKYKTIRPDLVTMDIIMPEMNGIEAVKKLLKFDPKAKVVMLSSVGVGTNVHDAIAAGAKNFVLKPYNTKTLLEVLEKTLAA